jgi:hypothetical protein
MGHAHHDDARGAERVAVGYRAAGGPEAAGHAIERMVRAEGSETTPG